MTVLASAIATVTFEAITTQCVFSGPIIVDQLRYEVPPILRAACRLATTGPITLDNLRSDPPFSVDGFPLVYLDRVLVKDQAAPTENGIYIAGSLSVAPIRALDLDEDAEALSGLVTYSISGFVNAGRKWILTTPDPITLGVSALVFEQFHGVLGSYDIAASFTRELYDAITGKVRWIGTELDFDGETIVWGRAPGFGYDEGMNTGEQTTLRFKLVGDQWAIPSADPVRPEPSTCPVLTPAHARRSPKSHGNKPMVARILFGANSAKMKTRKLFQGESLQKSNHGTVAVTGEITGVDEAILYADKPLCYELMPFSGLRRDEVVRQVAALVGLDPRPPGSPPGPLIDTGNWPPGTVFTTGQVICPIGKIVNKPILLSNASLLPFLNDFIAAENWLASFDENGNLFVRAIERKDAPELPDWILDEENGDFDLDSLEEIPPSKPPTRLFISVSKPVKGTGPGGSALTTTQQIVEEIAQLYSPQCVKVRPSGGASYLFGDGTYHTLAAEQMMVISRTVTDVTTADGQEIRRVVTRFGMYNPLAYDPNFNTYPPGGAYNGAYGQKSFHRDEAESLMEVSQDSTEAVLDIYGTILGTATTSKAWYAPHRAAAFAGHSRSKLINDVNAVPPAYVFAGGATRTIPVEVYGVVSRVEKDYRYGPDGAIAAIEERIFGFYSPDSRSDLIYTQTTPDSGPPTDNSQPNTPPIDNPPPSPPPAPPTWHPSLTGPTSQAGPVFTFRVNIGGGATGSVTGHTFGGWRRPANFQPPIPAFGTVGGSPTGHALPLSNPLDPATAPEAFVSIDLGGTSKDPDQLFYVAFSIFIGGVEYWTNTIVFDPWAGGPL